MFSVLIRIFEVKGTYEKQEKKSLGVII